MTGLDDHQLLAEFARGDSEATFAALVQRHINLVYSVAWRQTGNPHAAEEVTQAVFIILARKAASLGPKTVLSGWLYQTARLTAANYQRTEARRVRREQEAFMQSQPDEPQTDELWQRITPLLDDALGKLGERDRNAIVLRFFEGKSLGEVGAELGASEDAAKMRVNRALEKLRKIFGKRGVTLTTTLIAGAVSANSVQAAPVGLAMTVTAAAAKGAAVGGSTLALVKGALKIMAWAKAKTAIVVGAGLLLATGTTTVVVKTMTGTSETSNPSWADDPKFWRTDSSVLSANPPVFILRPTKFPNDGGGVTLSGPKNDQLMLKNTEIQRLLAKAYNMSGSRMVLPRDLPREHFDLMLTLPDKPRELLQQELKQRFGLIARRETRETDVLVLQVKNANTPGLRVADLSNKSGSWSASDQEITIKNEKLDGFAGTLESRFGKPVINQTESKAHYDIHLQWKPRPGESDDDAFVQALLDQLGLELVPGREKIEMLVVERVK